MSIREWPAGERPREKLLQRGAGALSDAELLAIFLRTGSRGKTAVDLARELLQQAGGLRMLLDMPVPTLRRLPGMGEARLAQLQGALELGRRHLAAGVSRDTVLASPEDAGHFLLSRLRGYRHEVFACLFLDTRHRMIAFEELFRGTIDGAAVYPREVARRCLELNAAALIVSHNHPSGVAEPSESDRLLTQRLQKSLELLDVRLLDHLVIGDQGWISLASRGWM